jgi:hypothetical protein
MSYEEYVEVFKKVKLCPVPVCECIALALMGVHFSSSEVGWVAVAFACPSCG